MADANPSRVQPGRDEADTHRMTMEELNRLSFEAIGHLHSEGRLSHISEEQMQRLIYRDTPGYDEPIQQDIVYQQPVRQIQVPPYQWFVNDLPVPDFGYPQPPQQISDEDIAEIPSVRINSKQTSDRLQCSICLEEFMLQESVPQLPCQHCFHTVCLATWLKTNNSCPCCRAVVV